MASRYRRSAELLERALRVVPLGSQTFSKSKTQYPEGVSPFFMARAKGRGNRIEKQTCHITVSVGSQG